MIPNAQDISSCLEFYTTAIFYDEKALAIQSLSQHQLGGTVRNSTDNANRLTTANYSASGETNWFTVDGMKFDGNGNITHMIRRNQKTPTTYGEVDSLTYTYQTNSNRLIQVRDSNDALSYTSKDFKERSATAYSYDVNGNLSGNLDKQISTISYNHLNLPDTVTFTGTTGKIVFGYDAAGNKLTQKLYTNTTLTKTYAYIGEAVYVDGSLDYLMHEEGRVAYELGTYQYEYHVKDHLGNVRQVLRNPTTQVYMATMETENATVEEAAFSQLSESRQLGPEHNVTEDGNQVAWLNADRGRVAGPGRTQPIYAGDSVKLRVHGKYAEPTLTKLNVETYLTQSAKDQIVDGISELAGSLQRSGSGNPIALLNLANILAGDLQRKEAPEAYLIYALYDTDSNRYEVGKQVLTKNAANQHEVLEENLYIGEDGYMETFVINETSEDVWFDDFMVMSTTSPIMQETHYDPWGLELTGIGFQYAGIKANKYLYNGGSLLIDELNLGLYWTANRLYDPVIGRFQGMDKLSDMFTSVSPMVYGFNNPLKFNDPTGLSGGCEECVDLNEVVVYATRLPRVAPDYGSLMRDLGRSSSPIYRNISFTAQNEGLSEAHQLFSRGSTLHFSSGEVIKYRDSEFMRGIRAMVAYGVTGSMVAAAASPMLIETLGPILASRTGINMTMEATWQAGNSLLFNRNMSQMDLADIGFAGLFGKSGYVAMAMFDYTSSGEFRYVGGTNKTISEFAIDLSIGGFNRWHIDAIRSAGVEREVVNFFNYVNNPLRLTVGTGIKEGVE